MIKQTITNAAGVSVLPLIDNTYRTSTGGVGVAACALEAPKGPVGRPVYVTDATWRDVFGKPYHPREGGKAEGLRHLGEAAKECQGVQVMRVLAEDAQFPSITFNSAGSTEAVTTDAHAYGTSLTAGAGIALIVYPKDGDPSTRRKLNVSKVDTDKQRVTLQVLEPDSLGDDQVVESLTFGFDPDDVDDMGAPAFVEAVFENQSTRLEAVLGPDASLADFTASSAPIAFAGGTNGSAPTAADYIAAWDAFRDMRVDLDFMFAAGTYDETVLGNAKDIADGRLVQFYYDAPPTMRNAAAAQWLMDLGISSRQIQAAHGAYSFIDPYYGGRAVWGYSGAMAAARARSNARVTGNVPGVHYSLAGTKRGYVDRRGARPLYGDDPLNKEALYDARLNPILANAGGSGVIIGDDLTTHYEENYSRFGWVTSISNYITQRFLLAAAAAKFEPDGLTRELLHDLLSEIMEEMVTAGALVPPRNPEVDGTSPYILTIEQLEIDLWKATWEICPTGAARRIAGQPALIK